MIIKYKLYNHPFIMALSSNILIIPTISTIIFFISKIIEMKFIDKEFKPLKYLFRDMLIVFISTTSATYIFYNLNGSIEEFMNIITDTKVLPASIAGNTEIFTDTPNF
jgi:hypothetical protein